MDRVLREAFRATRRVRPFTIDAIVVLPDHLHAVWTLPPRGSDFSGRWKKIKTHFTRRLIANGVSVPHHGNGERRLWQRRFWEHTIRDDTDVSTHVDYVHYNPVKHRLVARVIDWPHSSFHRYVRQGLLPGNWAGDAEPAEAGFGER